MEVIDSQKEATRIYLDLEKSVIAVDIRMPDGIPITNLNEFDKEPVLFAILDI